MDRKFGFGIIGCGVIAKLHQEQIQTLDKAVLVAVADNNMERAQKLAAKAGVDWYADYQEMLKRDDIDIVTVVTPSGLHAEMAIEAAKAGKHVVVEKPMDIREDKAKQMITACREAGVKLSVISQHRFDPSTIRVKEEIESGKLGQLVLGQVAVNWYRSQAYYDSGAWRGTWELDGGGALMNQSIHTIDLLQYLMGPVESIYAHMGTFAHERIKVEDVAVATGRFQHGGLASIVGTTAAYPGYTARLEVFGTHGSAVIDNDQLTHLYLRRENELGQPYGGGNVLNLTDALDTTSMASGAADPGAISANSHKLQFLDMMQAIEEDREPLVNGEEALKPLQIVLAIYESARTGQSVTLV